MKFSKLKSALGGRLAVLTLSDVGDQALPTKADVSGVRDSFTDGGIGEYAVRMEGVTLPPSGSSEGTGLRAKRSAIGWGWAWGGNAGTGGGRGSLDEPPLREVEGEREPRRKNVFFFLRDTSER